MLGECLLNSRQKGIGEVSLGFLFLGFLLEIYQLDRGGLYPRIALKELYKTVLSHLSIVVTLRRRCSRA